MIHCINLKSEWNIPNCGQPALPTGSLAQSNTTRGMTVTLALALLNNLKDFSSDKQFVMLILP